VPFVEERAVPVFPSEQWISAFCAELAADPDAGSVAAALDGVYRFVIEPAGPLPERHSYDVAIRPAGDGADVTPVPHSPDVPRLTLTADYERWRQLVRGELDIPIAVMLRRLRLSGDLGALTGRMGSAKPLLRALGAVPTQWLGA
jgi:hypothetical protein